MYKFRNDLLNSDSEFKNIFNELYNRGSIKEFSTDLINIIRKDKTPIRIEGYGPLAFSDLFRLDLTGGKCRTCTYEMVLFLDKLGIYSEAVYAVNKHFIGTIGSSFGGHWFVEIHTSNGIVCVDTSLQVMGSKSAFTSLGHDVRERKDIDSLFKMYPDLVDYQENMVIDSLIK